MKRTKWIVAVILLAATTQAARAQITMGARAGFSHTRATVTDEYGVEMDVDALNGVVIGLVAGFDVAPHLGLQVGAMYAEGGSVITPPGPGVPDIDLGVSYLELPLFLKLEMGGTISPYLLAGGVAGVSADAEMSAQLAGLDLRGDASPVVRRFSWALGFGGGIAIEVLEETRLSLEGHYFFGLDNRIRSGRVVMRYDDGVEDLDVPAGTEYKPRGFRIQVGLDMPLRSR